LLYALSVQTVPLSVIAEKAGVSKAAVSMALRNHPRISAQRKEQILKIAEELGYRPNPMVASLMTHIRSGSEPRTSSGLAVLGPTGTREMIRDPVYPYARVLVEAVEKRAASLGYSVDVISMEDPKVSPRQHARILAYRGIRGLIIPPFPPGSEGAGLDLDAENFAMVAVGYSQGMEAVHRVAHDQFGLARSIFERAVERGYRRIGLRMQESFGERVGHFYTAAFFEVMHERNPKNLHPKFILLEEDMGPECLLSWVEKNKLDCLVTQNIKDYEYLADVGYRIPEQIGMVQLAYLDSPHRIAGMLHAPAPLGNAAVELLTSLVQRNEVGAPTVPKTVLLPCEWMEGKTLPCRQGS
jgi:DNA-binding LacI/PurR family transcriptional regulator